MQVIHAIRSVSIRVCVAHGIGLNRVVSFGNPSLITKICLVTAGISKTSSDVLLFYVLSWHASCWKRQLVVWVRVSVNSWFGAFGDTLGWLIGRRSGASSSTRFVFHHWNSICSCLSSWAWHDATIHWRSHFLAFAISQTWHLQGHVWMDRLVMSHSMLLHVLDQLLSLDLLNLVLLRIDRWLLRWEPSFKIYPGHMSRLLALLDQSSCDLLLGVWTMT